MSKIRTNHSDLARRVDGAIDRRALDKLQAQRTEADQRVVASSAPLERAVAHFIRANIADGLWRNGGDGRAFNGAAVSELYAAQLRDLRDAARLCREHRLDRATEAGDLWYRIRTNLGNCLLQAGRWIEALAAYREVLAGFPGFGMAIGARGDAAFRYGRYVFDGGHQEVFLKWAHGQLAAADHRVEPHARVVFDGLRAHLEGAVPERLLAEPYGFDAPDPSADAEEAAYRRWCAAECLFLSPLNDLDAWTVAWRDVLGLPPVTFARGEGPGLLGWYSQAKQEYIGARTFAYEYFAARSEPGHHADRHVYLTDLHDYVATGVALERLRAATRAAYSVLDKVATFIDMYFVLGLKLPNFRTVWHVKAKREKPLNPALFGHDNAPLRALFLLSRDLDDGKLASDAAVDPIAQRFVQVRNALEHGYLKIHELEWQRPGGAEPFWSAALSDQHAYSLRRDEFEFVAMSLLGLARQALIYLSLAVGVEEARREAGRGDVGVLPMFPGVIGGDHRPPTAPEPPERGA